MLHLWHLMLHMRHLMLGYRTLRREIAIFNTENDFLIIGRDFERVI